MIYKLVPEDQRIPWLSRRLEEIVTDIRVLERIINRNNGTILFGTSSFPEADQFKDISVVNSKNKFVSFINTCNRCFVESVDSHGRAIGNNQYFWNDIKSEYSSLHSVLHKIRVYRNEVDHLELNHSVNEQYLSFIKEDLEGKAPSQVPELYFLLQQRILDGLLYNTQVEISKIS